MHQHSRAPPVTASPANSPRTNPARTNNPRNQEVGSSRPSSDRSAPSEHGIGIAEHSDVVARSPESSAQGKDNMAKLSQVVQVWAREVYNDIKNEIARWDANQVHAPELLH